MKKIITLLLVLTMVLTAFAGCGAQSKLGDIGTTEEITNKINEKGDVQFMVDVNKLQVVKEGEGWSIASFTGLTDEEFEQYVEEGYSSQAMINAVAHSMVVLKLKNKADGDNVAKIMDEKIDRRKWVCVGAEKSYANTSGEYVFFIMSDEKTVDSASKAFEEMSEVFGTAIITK